MPVRWLRVAVDEASEARLYYEEQRRGLGARFAREVAATVKRIRELPSTWPEVDAPVRRALVNRFPYLVHYALDGSSILILGVYHSRQRPISWRDRVK